MDKNIFDFDNTFVEENSSRMLERILLEEERGFRKTLLVLLFFSPFSILLNKTLAFVSIYFLDTIDLRLLFFLLFTRRTLKENNSKIFGQVIEKLNMRKLDKIKENKKIYICSKGLVQIIELFLKKNNIKGEIIIGSSFDKMGNIKLISFKEKFTPVLKLKNYTYYTDDSEEVIYLKKRIHDYNIDKVNGNIFKITVK